MNAKLYASCDKCGDPTTQEVFEIMGKTHCIPCAIRFILERLK